MLKMKGNQTILVGGVHMAFLLTIPPFELVRKLYLVCRDSADITVTLGSLPLDWVRFGKLCME